MARDTAKRHFISKIIHDTFSSSDVNEHGISINGGKLSHIRFADDIVLERYNGFAGKIISRSLGGRNKDQHEPGTNNDKSGAKSFGPCHWKRC